MAIEPVSRPSPRRRTRRALASTPLRLLRKIIEEANYSAFAAVPVGALNEEEAAIYDFVSRHYTEVGAFPRFETLEEHRINLPEAVEPLGYYRRELRNSLYMTEAAEVVLRLQEAIEDRDHERIAELLVQRSRAPAGAAGSGVMPMAHLLDRYRQNLDPARNLSAVEPTGIAGIDAVAFGIRRGNLGTLYARPGVGKTFFQIGGMLERAMMGRSTLFITREMDEEEVSHRLISMHYDLDPSLGVNRNLSTAAYNHIMERLSDGLPDRITQNVHIVDRTAVRTPNDVAALMREVQPDMTMVDGTYFLAPDERRSYPSGREKMEQLIRELRDHSGDTRQPLWITWQQNRAKVPGTEGIYGTDALSQDSALTVELRTKKRHPEMRVATITKNRHGAEGEAIGLSYTFRPTQLGQRVPIPTEETERQGARDSYVARAAGRAAGAAQAHRVRGGGDSEPPTYRLASDD